MHTLKLFDCYTEFPFDDESLRKQIDNEYWGVNLGHIANRDVKKIISKDLIAAKYEKFKKEQFYFKISEEFISFFSELGIKDVDSFLFPNPLHDELYFDFDLYFVVENIGQDFFVINKVELDKITDKSDYESLKSNIKSMEINTEYILSNTIEMNNYAMTEYKEGFLPEFNTLAQLKLEEIKES